MKIETCAIRSHQQVASDTYELVLESGLGSLLTPGQFVNVKVEGFYLRRPLSVAAFDDSTITLLYRVVGEGTQKLSSLTTRDTLSLFGPLGKGFEMEDVDHALLVGGGMGLAPLYPLAKAYRALGKKVTVGYGFQNQSQQYWIERFAALGCECIGELFEESGRNILEGLQARHVQADVVYGCGPEKMLAALQNMYDHGYISFESRMACAIGVCNGCICHDAQDHATTYKICKEGPVFPFGKVAL
ncbi:MAG: dihydroorotate dehydrogenase electron transfer subunit [Erysipelotrichaceae bacterium]